MSITRRNSVHVALLLAPLLVGCQRPPSGIAATNKEVVREFFAALDRQDFDRLRELLVDDFVLHMVKGPDRVGRDAAFEVIRGFYGSFPDYTHVVEEMIAEGDRVAIRLNYQGTHQGDFQGIAPTGTQISYAGAQMLTVVNGVITEGWFLDDDLDLMSQLGMELTAASRD